VIRVAPATDAERLLAASHLYDDPALPAAAADFASRPGHHLLVATIDDDPTPVGFVSGVEMVHPDKGLEMFLYELGVDDGHRGLGIGTALVEALAELARGLGCYDLWTLTDLDNDAALGTYRKAGATEESTHVMLTWPFEEPA
jgi:ribosomal protein S18 acetylase RimI-like enzyme